MKRRIPLIVCLLGLLGAVVVSSCKKQNEPEPSTPTGGHFNVWFAVGEGSASKGEKGSIVLSVEDLSTGTLSVKGQGVEVGDKLMPSAIAHEGYYYQVSKAGRFEKLRLADNRLEEVKAFPCTQVRERRYAHAWLDKNTLIVMGAAGEDAQKVNWVKIDVVSMSPLANGQLDLAAPGAGLRFSTSGMLAYRQQDGQLFYSYNYPQNASAMKANATKELREFWLACIAPDNMQVSSPYKESRVHREGAAAYGELRNSLSCFDEEGNYYLTVCEYLPGVKSTTPAKHSIFCVRQGARSFDPSYQACKAYQGKIIDMHYLGQKKALCYLHDPHTIAPGKELTDPKTWSQKTTPFVSYWATVDLGAAGEPVRIQGIPEGDGSHSRLAALHDGKAYIVVNTKEGYAQVYIYDVATGAVTKGAQGAQGLIAERIDYVAQ